MSKNLRKPFVAGNWKMNGNLALVAEFNQKLANVKAESEIVICAPSLLLHAFETQSFAIGAQNVSHLNNGAHTGELSVEMLKEAGCGYAIVRFGQLVLVKQPALSKHKKYTNLFAATLQK